MRSRQVLGGGGRGERLDVHRLSGWELLKHDGQHCSLFVRALRRRHLFDDGRSSERELLLGLLARQVR